MQKKGFEYAAEKILTQWAGEIAPTSIVMPIALAHQTYRFGLGEDDVFSASHLGDLGVGYVIGMTASMVLSILPYFRKHPIVRGMASLVVSSAMVFWAEVPALQHTHPGWFGTPDLMDIPAGIIGGASHFGGSFLGVAFSNRYVKNNDRM